MANTTCSNITSTGCNWKVDNLEYPFYTYYYYSAGVATGQANGTTTPPTGIKGSASAPATLSTNYYAQGAVSGLTPNTTYTLYGYAEGSGHIYYPAGSYTFTTLSDGSRPSNFAWTTEKTSGGNFNLAAAEWNSFTSKINEFRTYKELSLVSFTSAVAGNNFTASMFNQAISALSGMTGSLPATQSSGNAIYASYLNNMVSAMNSIA